MSKFPLLNLYRTLAIILAVIIVVVGVLSAVSAASITASFGSSSHFDLGTFIIVLLPFLGGAFGLGVFAELIQLFLRIEDHLDHIRIASERQAIQSTIIEETKAKKPSSKSTSSKNQSPMLKAALSIYGSALEKSTSEEKDTPRYEGLMLRATVFREQTLVRDSPEDDAASQGELISGTQLTLYGRDADAIWVDIEGDSQHWVRASDLQIEGRIMSLPPVKPV